MSSIYDLKPRFQNLLRPITNGLARRGVTANQLTLAALLLSFSTGAVIFYCRARRSLLLLPLVLFDRMLAREHNQKTSLGAILNELGDVLSDSALYLPLALVAGFDSRLVVLIVVLAVISEMTGIIGVQIGVSRRYDGPMGKSDRAFVFGALGLLLGLNLPIVPFVPYVLWLVLALLVFTIVNRARGALKELRGSAS